MANADDDVMMFTETDPHWKVNVMNVRYGRYDPDLQMFTEPSREPDMARLSFLRWLVERRRLEHGPAGAPCGDLVAHAARSDPSAGALKAA